VRAIEITQFGGPERLQVVDRPDPVPHDGLVVVEVDQAGVNYADTHQTEDTYLSRQTLPMVPGAEVVGRLDGRRVLAVAATGGYAERTLAHPGTVFALPDDVGSTAALAMLIQGATAWHLLRTSTHLAEGETVVVHAAAGGVGTIAVQLAKRAGATVLATASSPERLERLGGLGLDHGIDYTATDFVEAVRTLTDGRGADVIVDSVGGSNLQRSLHCLAYRGRCVTFGDAGRETPSTLDISTMRSQNQTLVGYFLGAELFLGTRAHAMIAGHLDDIAAGRLAVVIDRRFALEEAGEAHAYIESRQAFGRVLLVP